MSAPGANPWFIRYWKPVLAVAVFAAVAGVTTLRAWRQHSESLRTAALARREVTDAVEEGQRAFRVVPMLALTALASPAAVRGRIEQAFTASASSEDRITARDRDDLASQTAELLYYRFAQPEPGAYRDWRVSRGYRLRDGAALRREMIDSDYERVVMHAYPGDESLAECFDGLWVGSLTYERGSGSRPTAISADGSGLAVAFGRMDASGECAGLTLSGALPASAWHGRNQVGFRNWWTDPHGGVTRQLHKRKALPVALVGVIVEMAGGDRYPLTLSYYRDSDGKWWLWRIGINNAIPERLVLLEY